MQLTDAGRRRLAERLRNNLSIRNCSMCGAGKWTVNDRVFEMREYSGGNLVAGGPDGTVVPLIPATCGICGHTVLFSAVALGLVDSQTGGLIDG